MGSNNSVYFSNKLLDEQRNATILNIELKTYVIYYKEELMDSMRLEILEV